jgi:hypothetical protein
MFKEVSYVRLYLTNKNQNKYFILIILHPTDIRLKARGRQKLLTWLREALPAGRQVPDLTTVWRDGTILCDVIESVVPGSCSAQLRKSCSHRSIQHAQILATKYLHVQQVSARMLFPGQCDKWSCGVAENYMLRLLRVVRSKEISIKSGTNLKPCIALTGCDL